MTNLPLPLELLDERLRQTFGAQCRLDEIKRLAGGTRKQVFKVDITGTEQAPGAVVLAAWHNEKDYFEEAADPEGTLSDAVAPKLYYANTLLLLRHGVRVPRIYFFDESRREAAFAYALVEYMPSLTFNEYRAAHPADDMQPILDRMQAYLLRLHAITRLQWGTALDPAPKPKTYADEMLYDETLPDLRGLARAHPGVGGCEGRMAERLSEWRAQMAPRAEYTFIHNELGPDEHFLIGKDGEIFMLDIDGCHYADLEREHAYLKLRFGENYAAFARPDLDPTRMAFYGLCLNIMASYGHYLLLSKGFEGEEALRGIYEWNAEEAVRKVKRL